MISSRGKPEWLTIRPPAGDFSRIREIVKSHNLNTVCEDAHCPNTSECWSGGTATFMVLGEYCTRGCRFCAVKSGYPKMPPDSKEPENLANAVAQMDLDYIVITSVDRDDLPDQGAGHFAECIKRVKEKSPGMIVEVLIPDFRGDVACIKTVADAGPEVIAHNIETVERLQSTARDRRAGYKQSLLVLETVKKMNPRILTKSSIMLGLGETEEEIIQTMKDLRAIGVDIVTFGQYLRPSDLHLEVKEYVKPEVFESFKKTAESMGFLYCASGPFVRSSYRAAELLTRSLVGRGSQTKQIV